MRSELRRQIATLERELAAIVARSCPWEPRTVNPSRGPAVQSGANLEEIRDELLAALHALCRRIEGAVDASEEPAEPTPPAQPKAAQQADPPAASDGGEQRRSSWRRLTRR